MTDTSFPDPVAPFPDGGELLYGHRTALYSFTEIELPSQPPPLQKLRPIRGGNKRDSIEYTDFPSGSRTRCNRTSVATLPEVESQAQLPPQKLNLVTSSDAYPAEGCDSLMNTDEVEFQKQEGDAGNRWPEAETLALMKIRSEMDYEFRDENPEEPLWEIVSRNLERLGYHRDSKKCKEKFENIYKYYKRTKERKVGSQASNAYKFFSELGALHGPDNNNNPVAETTLLDKTRIQGLSPVEVPTQMVRLGTDSIDFSPDFSSCSSSDDSTSEDISEPINRKRKRKTRKKLQHFLESLMKKVLKKQEQMHKQLIEIIEKREKDWIIREEAWRLQEMERVKRDKEVRAQETSRNIALISFIQKILGKEFYIPQSSVTLYPEENQDEESDKKDNKFDPINRRWPKTEVQALITLRASMDYKFRSTAPKVSAWEEVSLAMASMGYNRSATKCKEKWENINKYFKRTMESGKKRSGNGKTCPYFYELEILYKNGLINPGNSLSVVNKENEDRKGGEIVTTSTLGSNSFSTSETVKNLVEVRFHMQQPDLSSGIH
ncbi:trihelix transcription factor GTL1-like [Telopea speciosissima]|uniref:trihelix transcription factor GTL1-like n=1 Tax=Telopea speciosissima TaxID=54955 RepID=UPI001CC804F8|nr:trihelix transcription factor GTL1-like [Telopea speciosissima]